MGRINFGDDEGLFFDLGLSDDDYEMEIDFELEHKNSGYGNEKKNESNYSQRQPAAVTPPVVPKKNTDDFDLLFVVDDDPSFPEELREEMMPEEEKQEPEKEEPTEPQPIEPVAEEAIYAPFETVSAPYEDVSFNWLEFTAEPDDSLVIDIENIATPREKKEEAYREEPPVKEPEELPVKKTVELPAEKPVAFGFISAEEEDNSLSEFLSSNSVSTISAAEPEEIKETEENLVVSAEDVDFPTPAEETAKEDATKQDALKAKVTEEEKRTSEKPWGNAFEEPLKKKKPSAGKVKKSKKKAKKVAKSLAKEIVLWTVVAVVTVMVIFLINLYVLRPSLVSGHSMDPTLEDGQTIMISKLPYIFGEIERGDIVVIDRQTERERTFSVEFTEMLRYNALTQTLFFKDDKDKDIFWIKRVIGVEGDTISFIDGKVYLNGNELKEDYIMTPDVKNYPNGTTFTVGKGELFVMGDNRNGSTDSRFISKPIKCDHIVGKMVTG